MQSRLVEARSAALHCIKQGFNEHGIGHLLAIFSNAELQLLVAGCWVAGTESWAPFFLERVRGRSHTVADRSAVLPRQYVAGMLSPACFFCRFLAAAGAAGMRRLRCWVMLFWFRL